VKLANSTGRHPDVACTQGLRRFRHVTRHQRTHPLHESQGLLGSGKDTDLFAFLHVAASAALMTLNVTYAASP
jgi:hypothetical protein